MCGLTGPNKPQSQRLLRLGELSSMKWSWARLPPEQSAGKVIGQGQGPHCGLSAGTTPPIALGSSPTAALMHFVRKLQPAERAQPLPLLTVFSVYRVTPLSFFDAPLAVQACKLL